MESMENTTRIKIAAAATTIAIGGLAGAGIALRNESEPTVATNAAADKARPVVIHRKRVKRVPVKLPGASGGVPPTGSAQTTPTAESAAAPTTVVAAPAQPAVSVPAPEPVSSRTSPAGAGSGSDDGSEHEAEGHSEHEGGD
jgi:hypothetical protein